jgi:uncharacterized protein (TIRG00374 family)
MSPKRILLFFVSLSIGLTVFFLIGGEAGWGEVVRSLSLIKAWQFFLIAFFFLAGIETAVWVWKMILNCLGVQSNFLALNQAFLAGFTVSYLTPVTLVGGEALRLYLLNEKLGVSWKKGMSSIIVSKMLDFVVLLTFVISGLVAFFLRGGAFSQKVGSLLVLSLGVLIFFFIYLFFRGARKKSAISELLRVVHLDDLLETPKGRKFLQHEKEILRFFNIHNHHFWKIIGLTFLQHFFWLIQALLIVFFLVGSLKGTTGPLIVYSFTALGSVLFIPAALGSLEIVEGVAFVALGVPYSVAVVFSLIWRGTRLALCFFSSFCFLSLAKKAVLNYFAKDKNRFKKLWKIKK